MAVGFGVLAVGMLCRILSFAAGWISYGDDEGYFELSAIMSRIFWWIENYADEATPILCGLALCLLARRERRYPDKCRLMRAICLGAGVLLLALGLLDVVVRNGFWRLRPIWIHYIRFYALNGPWPPLVIGIFACASALYVGRRGGSRILQGLWQVPLWPMTAGLLAWLFNIDGLFWPLPLLLLGAAFPLSMIVMLVVAIRVLLLGPRSRI
jgi:hypothetical protein